MCIICSDCMALLRSAIATPRAHCPSCAPQARTCTRNAVLGGYSIPAGSRVMFNILGLHRDPKHYPQPEAFRRACCCCCLKVGGPWAGCGHLGLVWHAGIDLRGVAAGSGAAGSTGGLRVQIVVLFL